MNKRVGHHSLRQRLLTSMAVGFAIILVSIAIGIWSYARDAANHSYDRLLSGAAFAILERTLVTPTGPSVEIPYSALELIGLAESDRVFYRIFTANGETLTGSENLPLPEHYKPTDQPVFFDTHYSGEDVRFLLQGRFLAGAGYGDWVVVQIGQTRIARDAFAREMMINAIALLLLVTVIGLGFVWFGINRALSPLIGIERQLRHREPTDFSPIVITPPREVASLTRSINGLILRHKKSLDNAQAFIADVAHQTRTSLGALQGLLESASRQADVKQQQVRIAQAEEQTERTIRLTNQLLSHAMIIHRADNKPLERKVFIDVVRTVFAEIIRDYLKYDTDFSIDSELDGDEETFVMLDEIGIREALRNLVDNTIKHGKAPYKIGILVRKTGGNCLLIVDDNGPGINEQMYATVLERFSSMSSGSGLGLSIVSAVADRHHAELRLGQSPEGGLRVEMVFPVVEGELT
ncbi:sensor histidine kinase [Thalassospira sp.]|uniref:sensor histidine kinase n=1 Tax=Thalassospira sp. TaxID=1912094 RepID=UPI001B22DB75|nr:sensor histidine kinase [Thalassospira sp.]MBO6805810.1 sensor histidine kinase [Thalassospira sp.]MBO6841424.1 sensor histidine kinase [Thalassospira sp.]